MTAHELKTWPKFFRDVYFGSKTFEVRKDDRGFEVGDSLLLREWDPKVKGYTGFTCRRRIVYILKGGRFGVSKGYVVMGIVPDVLVTICDDCGKPKEASLDGLWEKCVCNGGHSQS